MPAGRPTKYSQEILDKSLDYLENYEKYGDAVPQIAGLSVHLKIARETLYEWSKQDDKTEFSDIFKQILEAQHKALVSGGLLGDFNPVITKLMLSKHGYSERTTQDLNINNYSDLSDDELSRKLAELNQAHENSQIQH